MEAIQAQDWRMQLDPILLGPVKWRGKGRTSIKLRKGTTDYLHKYLVALHSVLLKTIGIRIPIVIAPAFEGAQSESLEVLQSLKSSENKGEVMRGLSSSPSGLVTFHSAPFV